MHNASPHCFCAQPPDDERICLEYGEPGPWVTGRLPCSCMTNHHGLVCGHADFNGLHGARPTRRCKADTEVKGHQSSWRRDPPSGMTNAMTIWHSSRQLSRELPSGAMDDAQLPFGTWEKVGDLLVVTALSYVAVVLVCWAWQWVNQRCGIDEETPRMQRWRFAFHPAKGVYGRALGTSHLIIGTAQVVYFVWRTWWAFYNTGTDVLGYCIGAFFAAEMLLHIVVAQPLQKTSTVINLEFFCNVVRAHACAVPCSPWMARISSHWAVQTQTATVSAFWTPLSRPRQVFALDYFRVITVFWTYETLSYYYLKSKFSDVQQKILHSALSALTLLSFFAFLIMSVENLDDIAWLSPLSEDDEWNAFTAFYFIMVNQLL